ncbi:hypothetical protein [Hyphomonas sp.]|jgi:hypothetical protein|uniref:hypothetical protein n=1 Tax=Hyphomonas sp. TaxID=87 RepID=UPI0032D94077
MTPLVGSRGQWSRLTRYIDRSEVLLLAFLTALFFAVYMAYQPTPRGEFPSGWEGWFDQGMYLKSARALAQGDLTPEQHWFQIGYAAIAAPFAALGVRDPFLPINLMSFLTFSLCFVRYFKGAIGQMGAILVLLVTTMIPLRIHVPHEVNSVILTQFVVPWNTNPVAALFMALMLEVRSIGDPERTQRHGLIGAMAAGVFMIRFVEIAPLSMIGLGYLARTVRLGHVVRKIVSALVGALMVIVPLLALTIAIHHALGSQYLGSSTTIGLSVSDAHERLIALFLEAGPQYNEHSTAIFKLQPWLYLGVPLATYWAFADPRNGAIPVATAFAAILLYTSYNDFSPLNVFRFALIHYLVWTLPVLAAAGLAGLMVILRKRSFGLLAAFGALALVFGSLTVTMRPLQVTAIEVTQTPADGSVNYTLQLDKSREIDAIDLVGASTNDWIALTVGRIEIATQDGRQLTAFKDYRMLTTDRGVRILLNRNIRASGLAIRIAPGGPILNAPLDGDGVEVRQLGITFRKLVD